MLRATELAHLVIRHTLQPGDWVVDATVGNGYDTLRLAQCVGPTGRVFGFDIQEAALAAAAERLTGLNQVTLFHSSHEHLVECLPDAARGRLKGVMFNLGYLPGSTKNIITTPAITISALQQALTHLAVGGRITIVLYPGHAGGIDEAAAVRAFAKTLPDTFAASHGTRLNTTRSVPELLVIERLT